MRSISCTVAVIGAGPAGIAAAATLSAGGTDVILIDDGERPGGQIWRGYTADSGGLPGRWLRALATSTALVLPRTRVVDRPERGLLVLDSPDGPCLLRAQRFVVCPGGRERFLPFPGWTLPGVTGAGGLQALVKDGLPIAGRRVVVAGSGPLLLAVAAGLARSGARIEAIVEQAPRTRLMRFGAGLWRHPAKLVQAFGMARQAFAVWPSSWVARAEGDRRLERVVVRRPDGETAIPCDHLACGFGLVPNLELPALFGCAVDEGRVRVDDLLRTDDPDVFCAGEVAGIGGVDAALVEGRIAGLAAGGRLAEAAALGPRRRSARRLAAAIEHCFALREELKALAAPGTLLCRCEDVPLGEVASCGSWPEARRLTRCGMGACQGRVCGPAAAFIWDWRLRAIARPPAQPTPLASLCRPSRSPEHHL